MPPPLPPRSASHGPQVIETSPWAALQVPFSGQDNRRRSTDSILPLNQSNKRKLLLIYLHGFMGDERSFQSFPAHVHNALTPLVVDSHVVHSKVYPRYRSKNNIRIARDDFSRWLKPHESETTDVILVGHSMGGLLAAEVALKPMSQPPGLEHRILGTINLDVPFLGMHPRVVKSGLQSIFQPLSDKEPNSQKSGQSDINTGDAQNLTTGSNQSTTTLDSLGSSTEDVFLTFNQAFQNDVNLPVRRGWESVLHFVNKHSNNLYQGTKRLVTAHLEFGGAMADYSGLRSRYTKIRVLETSDDAIRKPPFGGAFTPPRVRFVNYYTACNGRPKRDKSPAQGDNGEHTASESHEHEADPGGSPRIESSNEDNPRRPSSSSNDGSKSHTPSAEAVREDSTVLHLGDEAEECETANSQPTSLETPASKILLSSAINADDGTDACSSDIKPENNLPGDQEWSEPCTPPTSVPSQENLAVTRTKSPTSNSNFESTSATDAESSKSDKADKIKAKKDRKFCSLPPKDNHHNRDPTWVRVFMKDVDEIAAHCGLFFTDCPAYAYLVSDVAERIKEWVQESESERLVKLMMDEGWG